MIFRAAYVALFGAALWAAPSPAPANESPCRVALLLALDVSSSVDPHEDMLQRRGLASALTAPEIEAAFLATPGTYALSVFEWSGRSQQHVLMDWLVISSARDLHEVAGKLALSKRATSEFPTALGHAIGHAATLFRRAPRCDVQVLDVSGDGVNNDGFTPKQAYEAFPLDGVIVNGLAIETYGVKAADLSAAPGDIVDYYRSELIRGPGAFVEVAKGFDDFENAMRRKLARELSVTILGHLDLKP